MTGFRFWTFSIVLKEHAPAQGGAQSSRIYVLAALIFVDLALVACHFVSLVFSRPLFIFVLDVENNIPTWWSSTQLLVAGLVFGVVALRLWRRDHAGRGLLLLAFLLVTLSLDEVGSLHERIGNLTDRVLGSRQATTFHRTGLWFAVLGIPFAVLVVVLLRYMLDLLREVPGTPVRLGTGFAVMLLGAVGVEALSNFALSEDSEVSRFQVTSYMVLVALEEGLEMSGGSVLLWAAIEYVRNHWSTRAVVEHLRPLPAPRE